MEWPAHLPIVGGGGVSLIVDCFGKYCLSIFLVILSLVKGKHVNKLLLISYALQGSYLLRNVVKCFKLM